MSTAGAWFVVLSIAVTMATIVWMVFNRHHPENASTHDRDGPRATSELPMDRPADAGAESQIAEPGVTR